jgi:serine/threonine protein kinase
LGKDPGVSVDPHRDSPCLSENTLAAFAEGRVALGLAPVVEEHLADCGECRAALVLGAGGGSVAESGAACGDGADLTPGSRVGRYVIQELVGRGAMGTVYAATDPRLDRRVALKLLHTESSEVARDHLKARLLREAKAMARLSHPEVIAVHDVDSLGDQLFVAMEYVEGETLRRWRAVRYRSMREILAVYERAGAGLAAAHEAGLVHRDFKPDNVLVGRDGRVRVTDFGLALDVVRAESRGEGVASDRGSSGVADGEHGSSPEGDAGVSLTRSGTLVGTPAYMAPEQLRGARADARSDVFSFCVSLYEALYGERPFSGAAVPELLRAIQTRTVRAPPMVTPVSSWLRATLLQGLRPNPDERFPSMRHLLDALRAGHARWRRRRFAVAALALGAALTIGTAASVRTTPIEFVRRVPTSPLAVTAIAPPPATVMARSIDAVPAADVAPVNSPETAGGRSALTTPKRPLRRSFLTPAPTAPTIAPSQSTASSDEPPPPSPARREVGHNGALILE